MTIVLLVFVYFIAAVVMFAAQDRINDWEWLPAYGIYILLAPITVPVTFFIYLAYKFYRIIIKQRINK